MRPILLSLFLTLCLQAEEALLPPLTPATAALWAQTTAIPGGAVMTQGDGTITVVDGGVDLALPRLAGLQLAVLSLPVAGTRLTAGTTYRFRCVMRATPASSVVVAYPENAWEKPVTTPPSANTTWHQVEGGDTVVTGDFRFTPGVNRDTVALIFSPESAGANFAIRSLSVEPAP